MGGLFDDLDDGLKGVKGDPIQPVDVPQHVHMANGGEKLSSTCQRCKGTGHFRGRVRSFVCKACNGKGKVTMAKARSQKANDSRVANIPVRKAEWIAAHRTEYEHMVAQSEYFRFHMDLLRSLDNYGSLTDRQLAAIHHSIVAEKERHERFQAERDAKSGTVDISGIMALFATATDNDIKRPIFRIEIVVISKAPANGTNAGALYVKDHEDNYLGKIVAGEFLATRGAPANTIDHLRAVAADPTAEAIKYGRRFGRCSCCGHSLVDPVSIRAGVGPICAEHWGLEWRRDSAREQLRDEK